MCPTWTAFLRQLAVQKFERLLQKPCYSELAQEVGSRRHHVRMVLLLSPGPDPVGIGKGERSSLKPLLYGVPLSSNFPHSASTWTYFEEHVTAMAKGTIVQTHPFLEPRGWSLSWTKRLPCDFTHSLVTSVWIRVKCTRWGCHWKALRSCSWSSNVGVGGVGCFGISHYIMSDCCSRNFSDSQ